MSDRQPQAESSRQGGASRFSELAGTPKGRLSGAIVRRQPHGQSLNAMRGSLRRLAIMGRLEADHQQHVVANSFQHVLHVEVGSFHLQHRFHADAEIAERRFAAAEPLQLRGDLCGTPCRVSVPVSSYALASMGRICSL